MVKKELNILHEFLADQHVTRSADRFDYAQLLVYHSLGAAHHPLLTPFFNTHLKRRVAMLTQNRQPVFQYLKKGMVVPIIAMALFLFSFAPVKKAISAVSFAPPVPEIIRDAVVNTPANLPPLVKPKPGFVKQPGTVVLPLNPPAITGAGPSLQLPLAENPIAVIRPSTDTLLRNQERMPEIFTRTEYDAAFPGGPEAWKNFLEVNLRFPEKNNAPAGAYTAIVQFIVDRDGTISDIKVITDPGYDFGYEAKRVIQLSGKWNPAIQNKRVVKAYRKQPITFNVS